MKQNDSRNQLILKVHRIFDFKSLYEKQIVYFIKTGGMISFLSIRLFCKLLEYF